MAKEQEIVLIEAYGNPKHSVTANRKETYDGERNLSIGCPELRYMRAYLMLVGQWYPEHWSDLKKNLYHVWQALVTLGVWVYFVYRFGCLGIATLETQHLRWFPISAVEDIVWESRWVISHHLGLYYFCRRRHLERFLEESWLTQELWTETSRYLKRICLAVITFVFVIPVLLRPAELFYSVEPQQMWKIFMDTGVLAINRLVTAPILLVFVLVGYVLVRVVKGYGERIKVWPMNYNSTEGSGMRMAKFHFTEIKTLIRSVESAFQVYLALHFLLLLVSAVLGVFACAEQIERKTSPVNHSYYSLGHPVYYRRINMVQAALIRPQVNMVAVETKNVSHQLLSLSGEINATSKETKAVVPPSSVLEKQVMTEAGIEAVLRILESIVLYMVPLTLMLRLQTKLRVVRESIGDLDCYQQKDDDHLFQDQKSIDRMKEFVGECSGLSIFGYRMPLFKSFLLAAFAPFVTALTTFLFTYIHVRPR